VINRGLALRRQALWLNEMFSYGEASMKKAFQNSLFLSGLPLTVCGVAITAPGLWIPGLVLMVAGLATKKRT